MPSNRQKIAKGISYFRGLQIDGPNRHVEMLLDMVPQWVLSRFTLPSISWRMQMTRWVHRHPGLGINLPLGIAWNRSEEGHARYRSRPGYIHFAAEDQQRADREILPAAATEPNAEPIYQIGHAGSSLRLESVAISSSTLTWLMRSCIYWFATATRLIAEASRTLHDPCFTGVPFALRIRPR